MSRSYRKPYYLIEAIKPKTVKDVKRLISRRERRCAKLELARAVKNDIDVFSDSKYRKKENIRNNGIIKFYFDKQSLDQQTEMEIKMFDKLSRK